MADYNLGTASGRIVVDGSGAQAGFNVAQKSAGVFFGVVKKRVDDVQTLGKRTAAVGAAGVAGFGLAVKAASSFEKQMSSVRAVTGSADDEFESLRQKAIQLGADTVYSASEAALAIEELAKAGIPVEDILRGAADGAVALAAAGGVSLPEAAEVMSNAMNQFGIAANKTTEVADILAGVANTSAADVSGLRQSLSQAGAVADLTGLSFRDTAIALGELADAGIQGSDAGTSLKTMLTNLIPSTNKQVTAFEELGFLTQDLVAANRTLAKQGLAPVKTFGQARDALSKYVEELGNGERGTQKNTNAVREMLIQQGGLNNQFFDSEGKIKSLGKVQEILRRGLAGLSDDLYDAKGNLKSYDEIQRGIADGTIDATNAQKLQNLELLFGADAMRASAILAKGGSAAYNKFSKDMEKTTAAEVAKTRLDNLSGATEQFQGAIESAQITIGSVFIPIITKMVNLATRVVNVFNNLPAGVQKAIAILGAVASVGLLVVGAFIALLPVILGLVANFLLMRVVGLFLRPFALFFTLLRSGAGFAASAGAALSKLGGAFRIIFRVVTLLVPGIKLLVAAFGLFSAPVLAVVAAIAALVAAAIYAYRNFEPFRNLVNSIASAVKDRLVGAWNALKPALIAVGAAFVRLGQFIASTVMPVLRQVGGQLLDKLVAGFGKVWGMIQSDLIPAFNQLVDVFRANIIPLFQGGADAVQPLISKLIEFGSSVIPPVISFLKMLGKAFITFVLPAIIKVAGFFGGVLIDTIVMFFKGVVGIVTGVIQVFSGLIDFFAGLFTGDWSQMWDGIVSILKGIWSIIVGVVRVALTVGIGKAISLGFRGIMALFRLGWAGVVALVRGAGGLIVGAVKGLMSLVVGGIRLGVRLFVGIFRAGWGLVRGAASAARGAVVRIVGGLIRGVVGFVRGGMSSTANFFRTGWTVVQSVTKAAFNRIRSAVKSGIDRVVDFVKGLPGRAKSALSGIGNTLYSLGGDLMRGFMNGVKSLATGIKEAVLGPIRDAKNAVKNFLNSNSPSKVYMEIGADTAKGYIIGADKEADNVVASQMAMARAALKGFDQVTASVDPLMLDAVMGNTAGRAAAYSGGPTGTTGMGGNILAQLLAALANMQISGTLQLDPELLTGTMEAIADEAVGTNNETAARAARRGNF